MLNHALLATGCGAFLCACLRYRIGVWFNPILPTVPFGTLTANPRGHPLMDLIPGAFAQFRLAGTMLERARGKPAIVLRDAANPSRHARHRRPVTNPSRACGTMQQSCCPHLESGVTNLRTDHEGSTHE